MPQISSNQQYKSKNFDFIDSIRCIAMMCIVLEHCTHIGSYIFSDLSIENIFYMCLVQISKFGTISFFVLAGFLIGSKFKDSTPMQYFKRRLSTTFFPWLIWSFIFVLIVTQKVYSINPASSSLLGIFLTSLRNVYSYTNYWFIINFLICISILLIFRKYLYSKIFGTTLLMFTLVYCINIYTLWFPPRHTLAIFGFIFFLWLGAQCNRYWDKFQIIIQKTPYWLLIGLVLCTYLLSIAEIAYLFNIKSIDPYNTLRFSNLLFSLTTIALFLKIKSFGFTKYLNPRETTFGIYLIHYIMVFSVLPIILIPLGIPAFNELSIWKILLTVVVKFTIVYLITFAIVSLINKTQLKWLIGR